MDVTHHRNTKLPILRSPKSITNARSNQNGPSVCSLGLSCSKVDIDRLLSVNVGALARKDYSAGRWAPRDVQRLLVYEDEVRMRDDDSYADTRNNCLDMVGVVN